MHSARVGVRVRVRTRVGNDVRVGAGVFIEHQLMITSSKHIDQLWEPFMG